MQLKFLLLPTRLPIIPSSRVLVASPKLTITPTYPPTRAIAARDNSSFKQGTLICQNLLRIHWNNQYYVDLYLPFGLCSAPFLFKQLLDALEWVLKRKYSSQYVLHILDDFFIAEPTCLQHLSSFSTLLCFFMLIHALVVRSKTPGPFQVLEFMGIELDSMRMEAWLPEDKLQRTQDLLASFTKRHSVCLVELQSLIGSLQFARKVVILGRTLLQRMINLTRGFPAVFTIYGSTRNF